MTYQEYNKNTAPSHKTRKIIQQHTRENYTIRTTKYKTKNDCFYITFLIHKITKDILKYSKHNLQYDALKTFDKYEQ